MSNIRQKPPQWEIVVKEIALERLLLPFALFVLFAIIWELIMIPGPAIVNIWKPLITTMIESPLPFILIVVVWVFWAVLKVRQDNRERSQKSEITAALEKNAEALEAAAKLIKG